MKSILARAICRILILCLTAFPFGARAGMVSTDRVIAAAQTQGARDTLRNLIRRSDVSDQLQRIGISPSAALARVDAMTDAELASVTGRIDSLPAAGASVWAVIIGLLIIELIIYFWVE
ncbi:MAG: PA2779 family protein [Pseudomonadota bacterium]